MSGPRLRPYQEDLFARVRQAMRRNRRVLMQSPTGSGKSVVLAHMKREAANRGLSSWLVAHRKELIDQLSGHLWALGVQHGVIAAGRRETKDRVQVASIQSLVRRLGRLAPANLLVIDEAHHATATTYRKVVEHCARSWVVGMTATPERTDGTGLGDIFGELVEGPSVRELIEGGHLADYRIIAPPKAMSVEGVHVRAGDYVKSELTEVVDQSAITGNAVEHYRKYVHPKTCLVFCVSRIHARHVAEAYQAAGIDARYCAGDTPKPERDAIVAGFRRGRPPVIVSVDLFGEGLDAPGLQAVQLLRPTQSLIVHLQQLGRALRPEPGKEQAVILDHVGNTWHLGLPDDIRTWSLEGVARRNGNGEQPVSLRHCEKCFAVFRTAPICPVCGWTYQIKAELPEEVDGELQEIDVEQHRRLRNREQGRARGLEALVKLARERGYKPGWAARIHAHRTKGDVRSLRAKEMEIRRGLAS